MSMSLRELFFFIKKKFDSHPKVKFGYRKYMSLPVWMILHISIELFLESF